MSKLVPVCIALVVLGAVALPARAQDAEAKALEQMFQVAKGELTAKRDSALKTLVELDGDKDQAFWSLVGQYDKEMAEQRKQRRALVEEFVAAHDKLTAAQAESLADRVLDLDNARNEVRRKYFKRMSKEVSPIAAAQFLQLQGQFETMGDLKLATAMPLAGE